MLVNQLLRNPHVQPGSPAPLQAIGLSGTVVGVLANDPAVLASLGDAVHLPPYKAPPKAPVLFLKPRNTLACSGAAVAVPADAGELEIGASIGLVVGRTACRVSQATALSHLAGFIAVADLSVPHSSFYRPGLRFKARDGSCVLGPDITPLEAVASPDALMLRVWVDDACVQSGSTTGMLRPAAQLLADVTAFMTLRPGDVLMLGALNGAPRARVGQCFAVEIDGMARLEGRLVAEGGPA